MLRVLCRPGAKPAFHLHCLLKASYTSSDFFKMALVKKAKLRASIRSTLILGCLCS